MLSPSFVSLVTLLCKLIDNDYSQKHFKDFHLQKKRCICFHGLILVPTDGTFTLTDSTQYEIMSKDKIENTLSASNFCHLNEHFFFLLSSSKNKIHIDYVHLRDLNLTFKQCLL